MLFSHRPITEEELAAAIVPEVIGADVCDAVQYRGIPLFTMVLEGPLLSCVMNEGPEIGAGVLLALPVEVAARMVANLLEAVDRANLTPMLQAQIDQTRARIRQDIGR